MFRQCRSIDPSQVFSFSGRSPGLFCCFSFLTRRRRRPRKVGRRQTISIANRERIYLLRKIKTGCVEEKVRGKKKRKDWKTGRLKERKCIKSWGCWRSISDSSVVRVKQSSVGTIVWPVDRKDGRALCSFYWLFLVVRLSILFLLMIFISAFQISHRIRQPAGTGQKIEPVRPIWERFSVKSFYANSWHLISTPKNWDRSEKIQRIFKGSLMISPNSCPLKNLMVRNISFLCAILPPKSKLKLLRLQGYTKLQVRMQETLSQRQRS